MRNLLVILATLVFGLGFAQDFVMGINFDAGGKFDKSFNEGTWNGFNKAIEELKADGLDVESIEFEGTPDTFAQGLRQMAENGADLVVAPGFSQVDAIRQTAAEFPDTNFVSLDGFSDSPAANELYVSFAEHQGSYLVGYIAGSLSQTGVVGFVGGMDIPLIRRFGCGYAQGVKAAKADAKVIQNMTGDTGAAWNDPVKGGEITKGQMSQGADVVFAAAGGTGLGVLQAAADGGALSIGVDANQNHLHPGKVLTSMLKRVDVAVYNVMKSGKDGAFKPGIQELGLAEDGVGYAVDDNNKALITAEMTTAVEKARADIISGAVKVHDYMADNKCPVE